MSNFISLLKIISSFAVLLIFALPAVGQANSRSGPDRPTTAIIYFDNLGDWNAGIYEYADALAKVEAGVSDRLVELKRAQKEIESLLPCDHHTRRQPKCAWFLSLTIDERKAIGDEFSSKVKDYDSALNRLSEKHLPPVAARINRLLQDYALSNGYTRVIRGHSPYRSTEPNVVDITTSFFRYYNEKYPVKRRMKTLN